MRLCERKLEPIGEELAARGTVLHDVGWRDVGVALLPATSGLLLALAFMCGLGQALPSSTDPRHAASAIFANPTDAVNVVAAVTIDALGADGTHAETAGLAVSVRAAEAAESGLASVAASAVTPGLSESAETKETPSRSGAVGRMLGTFPA